ncbi:hypothetical protein AAEU32_09050 [Pseudoalteromonas sp. SSDWG2]|uniref:hypothetical protein n=1 Tax=Pseudoalteromonas sp. SSDWG2 TaxID=3139391 RepID=UPI003BA9CC46
MTLQSAFSSVQNAIVFDVVIDDLSAENCSHGFCHAVHVASSNNIVLNLAMCDVLTSADIKAIEEINNALELLGKCVIVCGINPLCAAIIFTYVDDIHFTTELDLNHALEAFSNDPR